MKCLDLFCCGGGASVGYTEAGFEVVGVDIVKQPEYPFEFILEDALTINLEGYDFYHASPPCQKFSEATPAYARDRWPDLIDPIRQRLLKTGKPFVIENVEMARHKLLNPVMLCGTMFNLPIWRHRYFEISGFTCIQPAHPKHVGRPIVINPGSTARKGRGSLPVLEQAAAMGINWMQSIKYIKEALPPAYTKYIGEQYVIGL